MSPLTVQIICGAILAVMFLYFAFVRKTKIATTSIVIVAFMLVITVIFNRISLMVPVFGFPAFKISIAQLPLMLIGALFGPMIAYFSGIIYDGIGLITNPTAFPFFGFTLNNVLVGLIPALVFLLLKKTSAQKLRVIFVALLTALTGLTIVFLLRNNIIKSGEDIIEIVSQMKVVMILLCVGIFATTVASFYLFSTKIEDTQLLHFFYHWSISILLVEMIIQLFLTPTWLQTMYGIPAEASMLIRQIKATFMIPLNMWIGLGAYSMLRKLESFKAITTDKNRK